MPGQQKTTSGDVGGSVLGVLLAFCVVCPFIGIPLLLLAITVALSGASRNGSDSPSSAEIEKGGPPGGGYLDPSQPNGTLTPPSGQGNFQP